VNLNRRQRIALGVGLAVFLLAGIWHVPYAWLEVSKDYSSGRVSMKPVGIEYGSLLNPADAGGLETFAVEGVHATTYLAQQGLIAVAVAVLLVLLKDTKDDD